MDLRERSLGAQRVRGTRALAVGIAILGTFLRLSASPAAAAAQQIPLTYIELEALPSNTKLQTQGVPVVGTALSLIELIKDQEAAREMEAAHRKPEHHSLLPRRAARQETQPDAMPVPGASPTPGPAGPVAPAAAESSPVVVLRGSYRPAQITAYVRSIGGEFQPCGADYSPLCGRVFIDRMGGASWVLPQKTVVAKRGYVIEGYDTDGPECGAFQLTFDALPPDADGVGHARFGLKANPTWPILQPADCTITLYEIPKPPTPE
jgi:hypothetical protein